MQGPVKAINEYTAAEFKVKHLLMLLGAFQAVCKFELPTSLF